MLFPLMGAVSIVGEILFVYFVFGKIFVKAGYSRIESLILLVPILNIIQIVWFAFEEWPIERELRRLKNSAEPGERPPFPPLSIRGLPQAPL